RKSQAQASEGRRRDEARQMLEGLSPREREVARLLARGLPNKLVARELDISEKTVHVHRQHVMDKAGIRSAAELARLMLEIDPRALD
ncbi:MAG: DNA-binding response regulator, partial [Rhodocyclaceae bacterium]|nr:DNA-binding response regulator [Rhodocyclaceae bacterium]